MAYIETAARYEKMQENGTVKKVTERFICDALTCTEAEAMTVKNLQPYVSGELDVTSNKKVNISEVMGDKECGRFYLAKVAYVVLDEKSGKEKKTISQILVGEQDFQAAFGTLLSGLRDTVSDWEIVSLAETQIVDYYPAKL